MDFMTGTDLIREIFDNLTLQLIWYNNNSIEKASYVVLIPIIFRNLLLDKYYKLLPDEKEEVFKYDLKADSESKIIEIRIRRNWYDRYAFEPYRPPSVKSFSEPWGPRVFAYEALISGIEILDDIISINELLKDSLISILDNNFGSKKHLISIKFSKPYISLISGRSAGSRIELPFRQETIFIQDSHCYNECDFITPTSKVNWIVPSRVHASQSSWARWYNPNLNICLNLAVKSVPNSYALANIEEEKEFIKKWWNKSVFSLVPKKMSGNSIFKIFAPSRKFDWSTNEYLCAWLQPGLLSSFRPVCIEADKDELVSEENIFLKEVDLSIVKQNITSFGIKLIDSNKARHMFAVVGEDPYPIIEEAWYTPINMIYNFRDIPSPISPNSRVFEFNVYWKQLSKELDLINLERLNIIINDYLLTCEITSICNISFDSNTITKEIYIIIDLFLDIKDKFESTDNILISIDSYIMNMIRDIEIVINRDYGEVVRATKEYWLNEIGMVFMD